MDNNFDIELDFGEDFPEVFPMEKSEGVGKYNL
jgi:hypothetical protein